MTEQPGPQQSGWVELRRRWQEWRSRPRERVRWWLGLLLLFAPIFYPLLFFKRYSITARVLWGMWLGLVVFVKVTGLAEPAIDIRQEFQQAEFETGRRDTPPVPEELRDYLGKLGGGILALFIEGFELEGEDTIRIVFRRKDSYFEDEPTLAATGVETAFSLFYGRDFRTVVLDYNLEGRPLRLRITREGFNDFFGMSTDEMAALGADREAFDVSAVANMDRERQQAFFDRFATERPPPEAESA